MNEILIIKIQIVKLLKCKNKMDNDSFRLILILLLTTAMLSSSSAEITDSVINLTYGGNFEKENAKDITLITETPLTDETQKILKIYSAQNWTLANAPETKNGKETIEINVGSANEYSLNFIVEKKFYEIKFLPEEENYEIQNLQNFLSNTGNVEWNEEIKKKAIEITSDNLSVENEQVQNAVKVFKIAKFVHNYITYDYNSENLSAKDVFKYKRATCMGYTNLFIAMCRSVGIPARAVGGIASTDKGFERHSYAEVFIGDWIPIDPTFGQFPADASHIAIYKDNKARGIKVELKFSGKNVSHSGTISAKFIKKDAENLISGKIINKNLTGKNSVMPINVELTNSKNFYVFGVCKISSLLKADADEKIFYLSPYEKKNITFRVFVPEQEGNFLYFYVAGIRCNDLNLTTNFTVDTDKTGNIYDGVVIENINTHSKEIELKNLNEENNSEVEVEVCVQNQNERNSENTLKCVNETVVVEKGADYVLKYNLEYPAQNFTLMVKCVGENFSNNKKIALNVRNAIDDGISNTGDEILNQYQNFVKNIGSKWYLIAAIVFIIVLVLIYSKFKKNKYPLKYKTN